MSISFVISDGFRFCRAAVVQRKLNAASVYADYPDFGPLTRDEKRTLDRLTKPVVVSVLTYLEPTGGPGTNLKALARVMEDGRNVRTALLAGDLRTIVDHIEGEAVLDCPLQPNHILKQAVAGIGCGTAQ